MVFNLREWVRLPLKTNAYEKQIILNVAKWSDTDWVSRVKKISSVPRTVWNLLTFLASRIISKIFSRSRKNQVIHVSRKIEKINSSNNAFYWLTCLRSKGNSLKLPWNFTQSVLGYRKIPCMSPSKYKRPKMLTPKTLREIAPPNISPLGGLVLGICPRIQSKTKQNW